MDELFEKLKKIIVEKLEVEEAKVIPESKIREDLGADSLDTYELLYAIEEEMGVTIPEDKASEFEKVGDVLNYLRSQQK
jgi:acyl carrier protein